MCAFVVQEVARRGRQFREGRDLGARPRNARPFRRRPASCRPAIQPPAALRARRGRRTAIQSGHTARGARLVGLMNAASCPLIGPDCGGHWSRRGRGSPGGLVKADPEQVYERLPAGGSAMQSCDRDGCGSQSMAPSILSVRSRMSGTASNTVISTKAPSRPYRRRYSA